MTKKKLIKIVIAILMLTVVFGCILHVVAIHDESYKFAIQFIEENPTIINETGKIKKMRLAFIGYSVEYDGPHAYAEYKIFTTGEKSKGVIYVNLEKSSGTWAVIKGSLVLKDKKTVPLIGI